jgi:cytosine/adenosine deaminase-related metal-dependent hydrolase
VWLGPGHELSPGEIAWDAAGRIVSLRRTRGPVEDLCVMPGLVDAHAHLQLPALAAGAPHTFLPWVAAVMAARAALAPAELAEVALTHAHGLLAEGVTAVGEVDATGTSAVPLGRAGLRGRCYRELTGYHLDGAASARLLRQVRPAASQGLRPGWSPHAPYSVSKALFAAAVATGRPLAIHCAELPEEQEFLHTGRGPFAELLQRLGRLPVDHRPAGCGAVQLLERLGALRRTTQLVHCQELESGDWERIAGSGASIAVCPGTLAWFGRAAPPVPQWLAAGIPVALGTDSRASSAPFGMRAELAAALRLWPGLGPEQVLAMATGHGARALACPGLGRLVRGGRADFFAVPAGAAAAAAPVAAFVRGELPVVGVWLRGRRWRGSGAGPSIPGPGSP